MRLSLALLPFLLFSGCLAANNDPASTDQGEDLNGDGRPDVAIEGSRTGVVFYNEEYQALPNEPLEFMVQVPEGARNVTVEMSVSGAATPMDEALVTLSACGQGYVSWSPGANIVVSISVLGGSWREADLCSEAEGGSRTVNVDTGATPMAGRILLRADLPDA